MPVLTVALADLGDELNALAKRDRDAVRLSVRQTLEIDAHRWIQWSIRGGGIVVPKPPTVAAAPKPPKAKQSLLQKLKAKLTGKAKIVKKAKRKGAPKKADPCAPRKAPAYRTPIDTGDYANSWRHQTNKDGGIFYSSPNPPVKAGVIENGRRPGPIPIEPLADWVRRKLGCNDPKKARRIAIAISRRAMKEKREGLRVLARAHPKIGDAFAKRVDRNIRAAANAAKPPPKKPAPKVSWAKMTGIY